MKPDLNVNISQITLQDKANDVQWVYINLENSCPDETGSCARIKLEIPIRSHSTTSSDADAIQKAKDLMACAIAGL
jgi:hypothetical protein